MGATLITESRLGRLKAPWHKWFAGESRRQVIVSISSLAGSGMISIGLRFVGSIIQGRFIGPETLGFYSKFTILPGFMFFLHLGVFTSLARQYPYYVGKGDRKTALSYAACALGWTRLLCAVHALVFLIPCALAVFRRDWPVALGWGTQILVSSTSLYMFYLGSTYRNSSEFVAWSKASVISAAASLAALPLVALYRFFGLCARASLPDFISMLYAHCNRPLKIRARLNRPVLKKMIAFGAPLMIFTYIATSLWDAVERSYILKMTGEKNLGVFVFAVTLCIALMTVSTSISQVFNPRIAMLYGSSGKGMAVSFRYCLKCSFVGLGVMLPLIVLTYWLLDPLVRWLLPKYADSIPIARCLCWLSLLPVMELPKQLLIVAKRTRAFGISVLAGFVLYMAILGYIMISGQIISLQQIVVASVACKASIVLISDLFAWREARAEARSLKQMDPLLPQG